VSASLMVRVVRSTKASSKGSVDHEEYDVFLEDFGSRRAILYHSLFIHPLRFSVGQRTISCKRRDEYRQ